MARTRSSARNNPRNNLRNDQRDDPRDGLGVLEQLIAWSTMFAYNILPTAGPSLFLSLLYILTINNPNLGELFPFFLRSAPTCFLITRTLTVGRKDTYRNWVSLALFASNIGDWLLMGRGETNFLLAMLCYAFMHLFFLFALGFEPLMAAGGAASGVLAMMWILLLLPFLSENLFWFMPPYIVLVCVTFWRAWSQKNISDDPTKICGALASLFLLFSHFNFFLNAFYLNRPFDFLNIITITTFTVGQLSLALSTFNRKVFEATRRR